MIGPYSQVVGLDLSLTATGVAGGGGAFVLCPPGRLGGVERLDWYDTTLDRVLDGMDPLVVLEGYSMGSKGRAVFNIGELGGVVRLLLWRGSIPFAEVAPGSLKKFATGKGNDKKDAVLVAAVRAGYEGDDNNEADAWWLRQMGLYHLGVPEVPITVYRTAAVKAVVWPAPVVVDVAS